jgi:hypothetical protein
MMVNSYLNTYLRIFNSSFPTIILKDRVKKITWITTGIKISCPHKRNLYLLSRDSSDPNLKNYYKLYCKILTDVNKEAKRTMSNNQILNLNIK